MNFKIVDAKKLDKNTLQGTFSLLAGPLKIEGFNYHIKNGESWISLPSTEYYDKGTGEKKYRTMVWIEGKDRYQAFQTWCKDQVSELFNRSLEKESQGDDIPF